VDDAVWEEKQEVQGNILLKFRVAGKQTGEFESHKGVASDKYDYDIFEI